MKIKLNNKKRITHVIKGQSRDLLYNVYNRPGYITACGAR